MTSTEYDSPESIQPAELVIRYLLYTFATTKTGFPDQATTAKLAQIREYLVLCAGAELMDSFDRKVRSGQEFAGTMKQIAVDVSRFRAQKVLEEYKGLLRTKSILGLIGPSLQRLEYL